MLRIQFEDFLGFRPWRRHSLVLFISGLLYIGQGLILNTWHVDGPRYRGLQAAFSRAPVEFWSGLFILVGVLAALSAVWPRSSEKWGYACLTGLACAWSALYAVGIIVYDTSPTNWSMVAIWAFIAFTWWAITGLVNPEKVVVIEVDQNAGT